MSRRNVLTRPVSFEASDRRADTEHVTDQTSDPTNETPDATTGRSSPDGGDATARKRRLRNLVIAVVVVAVGIGAIVFLVSGGTQQVRLTPAEADRALQQAGCQPIDAPQLEPNHLIDPQGAPPADELYEVRPANSGPHFRAPVSPLGFKQQPIEERAVLQNLERGAVVVWYDPQTVGEDTRTAMRRWVEARNQAGFAAGARGGAGIIVSPYPSGLQPPAPVALRAWHRSVNCAGFDATAVDAFLARNFGTRGASPNATLAGYPEDAVRIIDDGG